MKNKTNYSIVRLTLEIETPNKKNKKTVIHSKKISAIIHAKDNENVQETFVDFANSIEQTRVSKSANKPKNLFRNIWGAIKGRSKSSESAYHRVLRS